MPLPVPKISKLLTPAVQVEKQLKDTIESTGVVLPPGPATLVQSNLENVEETIEKVGPAGMIKLPFTMQRAQAPPPVAEAPPAEVQEVELEWGMPEVMPKVNLRRFSYTW